MCGDRSSDGQHTTGYFGTFFPWYFILLEHMQCKTIKLRSGGINKPPSHNRTLKKKIKIRTSSRGQSSHAFCLKAHLVAYFTRSRTLSRIAIKKTCLKLQPRKLKVWYPPPAHCHHYFEISTRKNIQCFTGDSPGLVQCMFSWNYNFQVNWDLS